MSAQEDLKSTTPEVLEKIIHELQDIETRASHIYELITLLYDTHGHLLYGLEDRMDIISTYVNISLRAVERIEDTLPNNE